MAPPLSNKTILITGATSGIGGRRFDILCALVAALYIPNIMLLNYIFGVEFTEQIFVLHGIEIDDLPAFGFLGVFVLPFLILFIVPSLMVTTFICGLVSAFLISLVRLRTQLLCIVSGVISGILVNGLAWSFYMLNQNHPNLFTTLFSYLLSIPILIIGGPIMLVMISTLNAYYMHKKVTKPCESLHVA